MLLLYCVHSNRGGTLTTNRLRRELSHSLSSEMSKGGAKLMLSEVRNSNWMDFQAVARPNSFRAHSEKMGISPTRSIMQVQTHSVYPQDPRIFQTDLGSLISPTEKL